MDAVFAVTANVFAVVMAVLVSVFDRPEDFFNATLRKAEPKTVQTIEPMPEDVSDLVPHLACSDFSNFLDPDTRPECAVLFYAVAMEMNLDDPDVRSSALASFETFKFAAAQSCRADWAAQTNRSSLPLSAACILARKRLASLVNVD
jgi:hypothetical protein